MPEDLFMMKIVAVNPFNHLYEARRKAVKTYYRVPWLDSANAIAGL
jgi:hypothetical protein